MLAPEDERDAHPYWYARVIGIYHVLVRSKDDPNPNASNQIDFLWIRWYGIDSQYRSGFKAKRLHRVGFLDAEEDDAFGFISPEDVLCSVYLLPTFSLGTTDAFLEGPSIARRPDECDEDYERYYVNFFVDRDMLMRYIGGAVGHRSTFEATKGLLASAKEAFGVVDDASVENHLLHEDPEEDDQEEEEGTNSEEKEDDEPSDEDEEGDDAWEEAEDEDDDQSGRGEPEDDIDEDLLEDPREELGFTVF
ncbi:hypothetical protein EV421DRAFT_1889695 [Armillaria borealis]|uniref:Uncharacterized protein n=1 Tax=Armillaria borealis TaxID=47425 RepID=A0AA39MVA2_9AGAR|nr:hypothetical protein EV421DRAFT_1889695 [Armillaria borealis]